MIDVAPKPMPPGDGMHLTRRDAVGFEVRAREADRELIRALARRLAEDGPEALRVRTLVQQIVSEESPRCGGVLRALRRSPMVGADLDIRRDREDGRGFDL